MRIASNARRWYYRMLTKNVADIGPNLDLVQQAIADESNDAREGLALGLRELPIDDSSSIVVSILAPMVADWYAQEESEHVCRSLRRHFEHFAFAYGSYREILEEEEGSEGIDLSSDTPRAVFVRRQLDLPIETRRRQVAIPQVDSVSQEATFLLAVDTVEFSRHPDDRQIVIFRDLLESLADDPTLRRVDPEDVVTLLTGDGLILALRKVDNRHVPLQVALAVQETYAELRGYQLRFGVHDGTAFWIYLRDEGRQLIGNAVNWAARVMSVADGGTVLVSKHYYEGIVRPDINRYRGLKFLNVEGAVTKHSEPVEALRVQRNGE
jgi:class 3 adenylate cyclase